MTKPMIPYGWLRIIICIAAMLALSFTLALLLNVFQGPASKTSDPAQASVKDLAIKIMITFLAAATAVLLSWKILDRRSWSTLGFRWKGYQKTALAGIGTAAFIICGGSLLLLVSGQISFYEPEFNGSAMVISAFLMLLTAVGEELLFRAYIITNLRERLPAWAALLLSALIFALAHYQNPSVAIMPLLVIFSGGLLLGISYLYTRNLWFCIALHFTWNFLQGPVLGYPVSGINMESILSQQAESNSWLSGGDFGFEGSVIALLLNLAMLSMIWLQFKKHGQRFSEA